MLGLSWNPAKEGIHFRKSEGLSSMERVSEGSTLIIHQLLSWLPGTGDPG